MITVLFLMRVTRSIVTELVTCLDSVHPMFHWRVHSSPMTFHISFQYHWSHCLVQSPALRSTFTTTSGIQITSCGTHTAMSMLISVLDFTLIFSMCTHDWTIHCSLLPFWLNICLSCTSFCHKWILLYTAFKAYVRWSPGHLKAGFRHWCATDSPIDSCPLRSRALILSVFQLRCRILKFLLMIYCFISSWMFALQLSCQLPVRCIQSILDPFLHPVPIPYRLNFLISLLVILSLSLICKSLQPSVFTYLLFLILHWSHYTHLTCTWKQ